MPTAVFIGANSDIAHATLSMLSSDFNVILLTRDQKQLPTNITEQYETHNCDPCNHAEVQEVMQSLAENNEITSVVNFCGSILLKPAASISPLEWKATLDINLNTAFNVAQASVKFIKKNCSLIFFSTAAAHIGLPNHEAIAAAKAGVEGLAKSLAASYAKQNIRANVIAPGLVQTKMAAPIVRGDRGKSLSLSLHALNKLGEPRDIASLVCWLMQPDNAWITGEVIKLDGGLSTIKSYPKQ